MRKGKWDGRYVCPHAARWRCKREHYKCPAGYYPVCGDLRGSGFKRAKAPNMQVCSERCNRHHRCNGFEYLKYGNFIFNKLCILNVRYPNKHQHRGQYSCYKYGAKCRGYNIQLPQKFITYYKEQIIDHMVHIQPVREEKKPIIAVLPPPAVMPNFPKCQVARKFICPYEKKFLCPDGFHPVCGSLSDSLKDTLGYGKMYRGSQILKTKGDCAQKCKESKRCRGFEYVTKGFRNGKKRVQKGTCILNPTCPNKTKRLQNSHTCYMNSVSFIPFHCNDGTTVQYPKDCPIKCLDGTWKKKGACPPPKCHNPLNFQCNKNQLFTCAPGYKPVCGYQKTRVTEIVKPGRKSIYVPQQQQEFLVQNKLECSKKCDEFTGCMGFQFYFAKVSKSTTIQKAGCILNTNCVDTVSDLNVQQTCYKDIVQFNKYMCGDGSRVENKDNCPVQCDDGTWKPKGECPPCKIKNEFLCRKKVKHSCSEGYYPVCGDVSGWGMLGRSMRTADKHACAKLCDATKGCLGFEYLANHDNVQGNCNLNPRCPHLPETSTHHTCYKKEVQADGF